MGLRYRRPLSQHGEDRVCVANPDVEAESGEARNRAKTIAAWQRCVMFDEGPRTFLMACRIAEVWVRERVMKCVSCVAGLLVWERGSPGLVF